MSALSVLAIDPGLTCGLAILRVPQLRPAQLMLSGEISGNAADLEAMWSGWRRKAHGVVVMEDWIYEPGTPTDARQACEPIGMVKMLAHQAGVPVVMQTRQFRKSFPDTEDKTPTDWWLPNLKSHDDRRQALRHGMAYIMHTLHHLPTMEHLRPRH